MRRTHYVVGAATAAAVIAIGTGVAVSLDGDDDADASDPAVPASVPAEIAEGFLSAFHEFDVDEAKEYFADDGALDGDITADKFEYVARLNEAEGFESLGTECETRPSDQEDALVDCTIAFHKFGSEERGLGPYEISGVAVVSDSKVVSWDTATASGAGPRSDPAYVEEIADPQWAWVEANVDPEVVEMIIETDRALFDPNYPGEPLTRAEFEEFVDMWSSLREEYVESVLQGE